VLEDMGELPAPPPDTEPADTQPADSQPGDE